MEFILKDIPLLHNPKAGLGGSPLSSKIIEATILFFVSIITLYSIKFYREEFCFW